MPQRIGDITPDSCPRTVERPLPGRVRGQPDAGHRIRCGVLRHFRTSTTEPKGNQAGAVAGSFTTTNTYDSIYQLTSVVNSAGDKVSYAYDDVGNVTKVVDPKKNATTDPDDYTGTTVYDLNHRVVTSTDAAGRSTSKKYDKDGLVVEATDAENRTTYVTYDERARQTEIKVPYTGTTSITYRTTRYEYDQVGNATKVVTPRGTETADTDDFAARTEYDAMNRPVKQFQPYDRRPRHRSGRLHLPAAFDAVRHRGGGSGVPLDDRARAVRPPAGARGDHLDPGAQPVLSTGPGGVAP
ncbi:hypothetical protein [Streptomyces sp. HNM0645]|uniref:hypothetical protein n=1 Tax=Streptomyces sp. HNM0645 TaxID=2782343 RepID=UPI0032D57E55